MKICLSTVLITVLATTLAQDFATVDNAFLCVRAQFTETRLEVVSERHCAFLCNENWRCQAFSVADGPCQLFVFDKCSKFVRDCSCSRRGRLFMKRKPAGVQPGASLCPSGFANDFCGTKYKVFSSISSWNQIKSDIESQPGLVIMADLDSASELNHVFSFFNNGWTMLLLGGFQPPGSPEPAGGWIWASCGNSIIMNSSLWRNDEPNNYGSGENVVSLYYALPFISDNSMTASYNGAVAECLSPFD